MEGVLPTLASEMTHFGLSTLVPSSPDTLSPFNPVTPKRWPPTTTTMPC